MTNRILLIFATFLIIISCQQDDLIQNKDEQKFTSKEDLENYIKLKIPNATFASENQYSQQSNPKNRLEFDSLEELDLFLEKLKDRKSQLSKTSIELTHDYGDGGSGVPEGSRLVTISTFISGSFYTNHVVTFLQTNDCSGSNITSSIEGFVLGLSYNHILGETSAIGSSHTRYSGRGELNYDLFYEGIATIYTEPYNFSGYVNCN